MKSLHLSKPRAIMMVGATGSGKSFFASNFSRALKIPYVDSLVVSKLGASKLATSKLIALILLEICKTEQTFILEGSSETKNLRAEFAKFAKDQGYEPLFVWVQVDETTSKKRAVKNKLSPEEYTKLLGSFEPPEPSEKALVISGKHTFISQARTVLGQIGKDNRPSDNTPAKTRVYQPNIPPRKL